MRRCLHLASLVLLLHLAITVATNEVTISADVVTTDSTLTFTFPPSTISSVALTVIFANGATAASLGLAPLNASEWVWPVVVAPNTGYRCRVAYSNGPTLYSKPFVVVAAGNPFEASAVFTQQPYSPEGFWLVGASARVQVRSLLDAVRWCGGVPQ